MANLIRNMDLSRFTLKTYLKNCYYQILKIQNLIHTKTNIIRRDSGNEKTKSSKNLFFGNPSKLGKKLVNSSSIQVFDLTLKENNGNNKSKKLAEQTVPENEIGTLIRYILLDANEKKQTGLSGELMKS